MPFFLSDSQHIKKVREKQRQMLVPSEALSTAEGPSVRTCPKGSRGYFIPEEEDASGHLTLVPKVLSTIRELP